VFEDQQIDGIALAELAVLSAQNPKIVFGFLKQWNKLLEIPIRSGPQLKLVFHLSKLALH